MEKSGNLAAQAVAEGPEHQGEQAERGDVGRGFGDGGDGEGAACVAQAVANKARSKLEVAVDAALTEARAVERE